MIGVLSKSRTALALGVPNLARVAAYRLGVRYGLHPVRRVRAAIPGGPFFLDPGSLAPEASAPDDRAPAAMAPAPHWGRSALWFGRWPVALSGAPPDWHRNALSGQHVERPARHWWLIPDFDPAVGDLKPVWEASRFDWVLAFAQAARAGDPGAPARLNAWLADWCGHNPPYQGPNWKCGQEASIRVMHLAMAALLLGQHGAPAPGMLALLRVHLRRIAPTLGYALAQDNNHGTSEAAALFIGGSWLAVHGAPGDPDGAAWQAAGRRWLENRTARLIGKDGSFSQYSLNYHRMMLDTLSMAELWRARLGLAPFSAALYGRAEAATDWLFHMVDPASGDAPNVGANDGARLLQLGDTAYRDFRPSVQLASVLFGATRAYGADGADHACDAPLRWLGIALPQALRAPAQSRLFDDAGFAVLRRGPAMALLRYPRFRFRPSQADALHVDLWLDGVNLLRDAGSYSYHAEAAWIHYFPSTAAHNTVQFDGRDQMPRWGRFLFADWLRTTALTPLTERDGAVSLAARYTDARGAFHERELVMCAAQLAVRDRVGGFADKAVLRWRLAPGRWRIDGNSVSNGQHVLTVSASVPLLRFELVSAWESRHYLEKTALPVLEIEIGAAADMTSVYRWAP